MVDPVRLIAKTIANECPACIADACSHQPGPVSEYQARRILTALTSAGVELTHPAQAIDMAPGGDAAA